MEINQAPAAPAAPAESTGFDITSANAIAECEAGYWFHPKQIDGVTDHDFEFCVQGRHSDEVTSWIGKLARQNAKDAQLAARRGKSPEMKTLDELKAQNVDGAVVRLIGWRGVKQEFDRDLARAALKKNPHWVDQITEESENLGNFKKATPKS